MINIFKINKALKQAKKHVEEVNQLNDELTAVGKRQNEIIADQQTTIESLQKQLEAAPVDRLDNVFAIIFDHHEGMNFFHENVFTSKQLAVDCLLAMGYQLDKDATHVETYLNDGEQTLAFVFEKTIIKNSKTEE